MMKDDPINRPFRPLAFFSLLVVAALILSVHLLTIHIPYFWQDDASFADFAMHGQLLSRTYFHVTTLATDYRYAMWLVPIYLDVVRLVIHVWGVSDWSIRIPSVAAGMASLGLVCLIIHRLRWPLLCQWAAVAFFSTPMCFILAHEARPENLILCCLLFNILWLLSSGNRVLSFVAGLLGTFSVGMHVVAVFFLIVITLLIPFRYRTGAWRDFKSIAWWAIGAIIGGMIFLGQTDMSAGMQSLKLLPIISPHELHQSAISLCKSNPVAMVMTVLHLYLGDCLLAPTSWHGPAFAVISVLILWRLRRWNTLSADEKIVLLYPLLSGIIFGLFTESWNWRYSLFTQPVVFIAAIWIAWDILRGEIILDGFDALFALALLWILWPLGWFGPFVTSAMVLLLASCYCQSLRYHSHRIPSVALALLFILFNIDVLSAAYVSLGYLLQSHRLAILSLAAVVFCLSWTRDGLAFLGLGRMVSGRVMAGLGLTILCIFSIDGIGSSARYAYHHRAPNNFPQLVQECRTAKRIAGPMCLWLYSPTSTVQDPDALLSMVTSYRFRGNFIDQLSSYNADLILLEDYQYKYLRDQVDRLYPNREVKIVRLWPELSPEYKNLNEVTLHNSLISKGQGKS